MSFTEREKEIIRQLADGDNTVRDKAVAIHRNRMREHGMRRGEPYFNFMSEVDNPCPDLNLRARYRRQVLEAPNSLIEKVSK